MEKEHKGFELAVQACGVGLFLLANSVFLPDAAPAATLPLSERRKEANEVMKTILRARTANAPKVQLSNTEKEEALKPRSADPELLPGYNLKNQLNMLNEERQLTEQQQFKSLSIGAEKGQEFKRLDSAAEQEKERFESVEYELRQKLVTQGEGSSSKETSDVVLKAESGAAAVSNGEAGQGSSKPAATSASTQQQPAAPTKLPAKNFIRTAPPPPPPAAESPPQKKWLKEALDDALEATTEQLQPFVQSLKTPPALTNQPVRQQVQEYLQVLQTRAAESVLQASDALTSKKVNYLLVLDRAGLAFGIFLAGLATLALSNRQRKLDEVSMRFEQEKIKLARELQEKQQQVALLNSELETIKDSSMGENSQ